MHAFDGLGKALRWLRDKQDKKQYEVADTAGVTKAMLSAYETGKQRPSIDTLEKILDALRVDLGDLYYALQTVNERPVRWRPIDRPDGRSEAALPLTGAGGEVDVYRTLGLSRTLHRSEEEAYRLMLEGFHRLLRYYHDRAADPAGRPLQEP